MKWNRIGRMAAMAMLALVVASCEHVETPTEASEPQEVAGQPEELLGIDLGGLLGQPRTVRAIDQYGNVDTYELVRKPILSLDLRHLRVSKLISVNGGTLSLLGNTITVPRGAVDAPTLFTLIVLPTGYVQVDVSALLGNLLGGILNIGEDGFNRPVQLTLNYDGARVNRRDEDDLVVLRMNPRGWNHLHEVIPTTVDERNNEATVWLEHFSGYCMAM